MLKKFSFVAKYFNPKSIESLKYAQIKCYCQTSKLCWNCKVSLNESTEIFCQKCKKIQEIPNADYFQLFGIEQQHNIDQNALTTKFRHFQNQIHPDKFSGKHENEQSLSSEWSSLINKAYKILQSPLERAEYLVRLRGITLPENNTINDPEFLMEMMDKNEEVENSETKEDLTNILQSLRDEITDLSNDFSTQFQAGNLSNAVKFLIKMKYLTSIEKSIKEKLLRI